MILTSGKSISQISRESGVKRTTIGSWINRTTSPTVFNAEAVLNTIGYTLILSRLEKTEIGKEGKCDSNQMLA
jgi:DNA-binding phage protein